MIEIENVEGLLSIIGTIISLMLTCVIFIIKIIRNRKQKKKLEEKTILMDAIMPLMELAEKYVNYSGEEKKEYVMTKLNQLAIEHGLGFNVEEIGRKIEELITLSKEVNNRNKQNTKEVENI